MIRLATEADIPRLTALTLACHAESPVYSQLAIDEALVAAHFERLTSGADSAVFVYAPGRRLAGFATVFVTTHWCSEDLIAYEDMLFMEKNSRGSLGAARLIAAIRDWAGDQGALFLFGGSTTGVKPGRTARLYNRLGFDIFALGVSYRYPGKEE